MLVRLAAWSIADNDRRDAFARHIGQLLGCHELDGGAGILPCFQSRSDHERDCTQKCRTKDHPSATSRSSSSSTPPLNHAAGGEDLTGCTERKLIAMRFQALIMATASVSFTTSSSARLTASVQASTARSRSVWSGESRHALAPRPGVALRGADLHEVDQRLLEPKGVVFAPSSFRAKARLIYFNAFSPPSAHPRRDLAP
jgi:hypothetical protein